MGSNDAQRRTYVLRHGHFVTLPEGLQMVVPTKIWPVVESQLFGWGTKVRMATRSVPQSAELCPTAPWPISLPIISATRRSITWPSLCWRASTADRPTTSAPPSVLPKFVEYEQRYGSVVVGTLRDKRKPSGQSIFKSLRGGMGTLIDALVSRVNVVRAPVEAIRPRLELVFAEGHWQNFDHVVLACGANRAAPLIAPSIRC